MASRRNLYQLDFQKKLLHAVVQSPKAEALKLLAIIDSNLKEFATVRIPQDGDFDGCVEALMDTYEMIDSVIARKFPSMYADHTPEGISRLVPMLIDAEYHSKKSQYGNKADYICLNILKAILGDKEKNISGEPLVGGLYAHNGRYYHYLAWLMAVTHFMSESNMKLPETRQYYVEYQLAHKNQPNSFIMRFMNFDAISYIDQDFVGHMGKIAAPESPVYNPEFATELLMQWIEDSHITSSDSEYQTTVKMRYPNIYTHPRMHGGESAEELESVYVDYDYAEARPHLAVIGVSNMLMFDMGKCLGGIREDAKNLAPLCYEDDPDDYVDFRDVQISSTAKRMLFRGPYHITNFIEKWVAKSGLVDLPGMTPYPGTKEVTINEIIDQVRGFDPEYFPYSKSYMTIYRTDEVPHSFNETFTSSWLEMIFRVAVALGHNAHFYVEGRARGDEENNIRLVHVLKTLGASVHVLNSPMYYKAKTHAKFWCFKGDSGNNIVLWSTGNFSTQAFTEFSDTHLISFNDPSVNDIVKAVFSSGPYTKQYDPTDQVFFAPGHIRKKLLEMIQMCTMRAKSAGMWELHTPQPFIILKLNHLTDPDIQKALVDAAKSGVDIRIIARTTCAIPTKFSRQMHLRTIVGKYLEHDRIFIFGMRQPGRGIDWVTTFIGSADLMERNLDRRIEFMRELEANEAYDTYYAVTNMLDTETDAKVGFFNIEER